MRWLDDVSVDPRKMGVNEWRDRAKNRKAWRHFAERPRPTPGCSAIWSDITVLCHMFLLYVVYIFGIPDTCITT